MRSSPSPAANPSLSWEPNLAVDRSSPTPAYLPPRFLPLSIVDVTQSGSLYEALDTQFGVRPLRAVQTVGARLATQTEAKYLKLPRDVPVLSKQRVTYGLDERPMEFVLCAARSDKFRLVFELE
jgi:DNA-binding GntR family transcriptional regulator